MFEINHSLAKILFEINYSLAKILSKIKSIK